MGAFSFNLSISRAVLSRPACQASVLHSYSHCFSPFMGTNQHFFFLFFLLHLIFEGTIFALSTFQRFFRGLWFALSTFQGRFRGLWVALSVCWGRLATLSKRNRCTIVLLGPARDTIAGLWFALSTFQGLVPAGVCAPLGGDYPGAIFGPSK